VNVDAKVGQKAVPDPIERRACPDVAGSMVAIHTGFSNESTTQDTMATVYFEDLDVGSVHLGRECACDREEMLEFSRRNDPWPFHVDEVAAAQSPFGGLIASGGYIVTLWYRSLTEIYNTPKATWAFLGAFDWKLKFLAPVRPADALRARVTVKDKRPWIKPGRGLVTLANEIVNQRAEVVCTVEVLVLLATRPQTVSPAS
jgi:acyl dehydratase